MPNFSFWEMNFNFAPFFWFPNIRCFYVLYLAKTFFSTKLNTSFDTLDFKFNNNNNENDMKKSQNDQKMILITSGIKKYEELLENFTRGLPLFENILYFIWRKYLWECFHFVIKFISWYFLVNVYYLGVLLSLHSQWHFLCILAFLLIFKKYQFCNWCQSIQISNFCIDLKIKLILYSSQGFVWF